MAAGPGGGDDIEYLGRADAQVQLRGFRIEFGEVEAGLLSADGVVGAAARILSGPSGDTLVGYVVADTAAVDPVAQFADPTDDADDPDATDLEDVEPVQVVDLGGEG